MRIPGQGGRAPSWPGRSREMVGDRPTMASVEIPEPVPLLIRD